MHRRLAVPMLPLRVWVHCPRASNGLLPPRSYLVGYVRWYARSDSVLLFPPSDNHSNSFQFAQRYPYRDLIDCRVALQGERSLAERAENFENRLLAARADHSFGLRPQD